MLSDRQLDDRFIYFKIHLERMQEQMNSQVVNDANEGNTQSPDLGSTIEENKTRIENETSVESDEVNYNNLTDGELVEAAKSLMKSNPESFASIKEDMEAIKRVFYRNQRVKNEALLNKYLEDGGEKEDFAAPVNPLEEELREILNRYKEKRAGELLRAENEKKENLETKKRILDEIKTLLDSEEDFSVRLPKLKQLQQEWKAVGAVPPSEVNSLWKTYQLYVENFYDNLKINNELRDYDFRKNLELKTALCEQTEKLADESDVVLAFRRLQLLHEEWREIGPVSAEYREAIWTRFKEASTVINKRHHDYFDQLKSQEVENLQKKTALCEKIESIDLTDIDSYKAWQEKSEEVIAIQEEWKQIGFAPKKENVSIYERFRTACDNFFKTKNAYFKNTKEQLSANLNEKIALCEKAESMKDSTDWKQTTDAFVKLQKEWKTIGPVQKKQSEAVWKRFVSACDYFFKQKNEANKTVRDEQQENLKKKKEILENIKSLQIEEGGKDAYGNLKSLIAEWNAIGHVPFKDKDKLYKAYKSAIDEKFDQLNIDHAAHRMDAFKSNLQEISEKGQEKAFFSERRKLLRQYDAISSEIATYENNIGFFSHSKNASGMIKEMEGKIAKLKREKELLSDQIKMMEDAASKE